MPQVLLEVPEAPEDYNIYKSGDITVYVGKSVHLSDPTLKFVLRGFLFFKKIVAIGVNKSAYSYS